MHTFIPSIGSPTCHKCKRKELDHTDLATCEACPNVGPCELYPDISGMLLCHDCIDKEEKILMSPEKQQERVDASIARTNELIEKSRAVDFSIKVREDIFNAQTISIQELKTAIDNDSSIENKHFTLANELTERYRHFSKLIFDKQAEIVEESNKQRAVQSYLNQLSNKLRQDERDKLKLHDINYKPSEKPVSKPKTITTAKKYDKTELVKYANETGIPLAALQMLCVSKNMTPQQAAEHMKKIMNGIEGE